MASACRQNGISACPYWAARRLGYVSLATSGRGIPAYGTELPSWNVRALFAIGGKADVNADMGRRYYRYY